MNDLFWRTEKRKIKDLKLFENNPRKMSKQQAEQLLRSLKKFNLVEIPAIDQNNRVIAGNMRVEALRKLYGDDFEIEVRVPSRPLTEEEAKEYLLRSNKNTGEWDFDLLASFGEDLLKEVGFENFEIENVFTKDLLSIKDENIESLGEVYDLKDDCEFESEGNFDLPVIRSDMILEIENLNTWAGPLATTSPPPYLYNYGTDSIVGLDLSKTVIAFYTEDNRFERLWTHTPQIIKRFLNKKILGMVSPNFSTYFNMARAIRIYNVYRSRWIARYSQEAGIKVIIDISGAKEDVDFIFDGLPKNKPYFIQAHRKYTKFEISEKILL